ncbi:RNF144A family protein [Megaselia abdita]
MRPPQLTTNRNEGGGQERLVSVSQKKRSDNSGNGGSSVKKRIIQNPVFEDNCRKLAGDNSSRKRKNFDGSSSTTSSSYFNTVNLNVNGKKNPTRKFPQSETEPLLSELTVSQQSPTPTRTIYLNKNSSTSLIFTKKDLDTISETSITTASNNRKQHAYSWYAPVYSALEEEFEQDSKESSPIHNLAALRKTSADYPAADNETLALLETKNHINIKPAPNNNTSSHRVRTKPSPIVSLSSPISNSNSTNGTTIPPITLHYQNKIEGPQLSDRGGGGNTVGGPTNNSNTQQPSRRKRFENFIKSLVGRKSNASSYTKEKEVNNSGTAITTTTTNANTPTTPPPSFTTPEITINPSISINDISINRDGSGSSSKALGLGPPSCSTTSLNLVQQKLWNVVPVLRNHGPRCTGSVTDLSHSRNHQSQSLNIESHRQYNYNVGSEGLRKCETVIAFNSRQSLYEHIGGCPRVSVTNATLGGKKTTSLANGVEQIRPLNRLRNSLSTSNATCSRCSSLLSLAGAGSRYSLNVSNHFSNDSLCNIAATTNNTTIINNNNSNQNHKSKLSLLNGVANATQDSGVDVDDDKHASSSFSSSSSSSSSTSSSSPQPPLFTQSSTNLTVLNGGSNDHNGGATITCKLCLLDVTPDETTIIKHCGCQFCTECMKAYVEFEISEGAYEISCPDAECSAQGCISLDEISSLTSNNLLTKHQRYRLNREIDLDKNRTWCPRAGCETICQVGSSFTTTSKSNEDAENSTLITQILCAVQCPTCKEEFCSGCKKPWHPNISCDENNRRLAAEGQDDIGIPFDNELIKSCPMCAVPIEKDEGCAQMMCKRCKHVFCWYCLASLDDDFLLRHYDKGPCKNKLGHSRASVVWHRAQVIGIFAGFGILLLVASPLLLLAAPCIICCKCRICSGTKIEENEVEFSEGIALQR